MGDPADTLPDSLVPVTTPDPQYATTQEATAFGESEDAAGEVPVSELLAGLGPYRAPPPKESIDLRVVTDGGVVVRLRHLEDDY